jgi:hypothetical protein
MSYATIAILGSPVVKERTANAAITPGHLIELMSTNYVRVHATAGGTAQKMFALEDENQGNEISDAYTAANVCRYGVFSPGQEVYAILADGETAVIGSKLESNGDGTLRVVDTDASAGDIGVQSIVGIALEAVDMSGSSGEDPSGRIRIEII